MLSCKIDHWQNRHAGQEEQMLGREVEKEGNVNVEKLLVGAAVVGWVVVGVEVVGVEVLEPSLEL